MKDGFSGVHTLPIQDAMDVDQVKEVEGSISLLPPENLSHIFSFLTLQELVNASEANTLWGKVAYQKLIQQYFPYVVHERGWLEEVEQEYSCTIFKIQGDFKTNPQLLFQQACEGIVRKLVQLRGSLRFEYNDKIRQLFSYKKSYFHLKSLQGDFSWIESLELKERDEIIPFYILGTAHGHLDTFAKLDETGKWKAIKTAISLGHVQAAQMLLNQRISPSLKDIIFALKLAIRRGFDSLINDLIIKAKKINPEWLSLKKQEELANDAAISGHLNLIEPFLVELKAQSNYGA